MSPIVIITALESGFGFLLTSAILYLVLRHARKSYHYLFAAFLFICVVWDLGILLMMIRNERVDELDIIGRIAVLPCIFIPALIFHFANLYTGKPIKWAIIVVWVATVVTLVPILAGVFYQIEGYYSYDWGNIFRIVPTVFDPLIFIVWFGINLSACWLLINNARKTTIRLERKHYFYIIAGLLVVTFAVVKTLVTQGIDLAFLLPLGMFLNDAFATIIGLAIIKERLFDITVIIKKGTLYSILAALLIFVYSFVEHFLVTFIGEKIGESSTVLHLISVAVGIAVLMPVKNRIEKAVDGYFAQRKLEF
jgi:hypothetical protein